MKSKSIKILAIDGGGIRGIVSAMILDEIQRKLNRELHTAFDLIAGTSTGGIIGLGIGTRCNNGMAYTPKDLINLYISNGPIIFKKNCLTFEKELFYPKYSASNIEAVLKNFFQDTEFSSALTPLLISSYNLQLQQPFFFKSHNIAANPDENCPIATIARATSGSPTYFSPLLFTRGTQTYNLVDGGVFVNNPSMIAYVEARSLYSNASRFTIVSVGSGSCSDPITFSESEGWGLLSWAKQIIPIFMDSASLEVDYELNRIPNSDYFRFQIDFLQANEAAMDNASPQNMANLQAVTKEYLSLESTIAKMNQLCAILSEGRAFNMPGVGEAKINAPVLV